jgi:queuine tRNA-ribosyltransferase
MGWSGPILTDSGGFQTYSLAALARKTDDGLEIRSPVDGSKHLFTPERVIEIQRRLGTDFMMPLDLCPPGDSDRKTAERALDQTKQWAQRSRLAYDESKPLLGRTQALFGIVQGGIYTDLRRQAVQDLLEIGFFGYAMGGLAVGEAPEERWRVVEWCDELLPTSSPRYLMGVGTPEDLKTAVRLGVDLFDCVLPTRNGRKGNVFTAAGKLNLRNAAFKDDPNPIEAGCTCYACRIGDEGQPRFSRGAIRHLLSVKEVLGSRLGAIHNLTHFLKLMVELRAGIIPPPSL